MNPIAAGDRFTLFVYGTLMRGGVRHWLLAGQRFLREARSMPRYALFDLGAYPGMVRREEGGRAVSGELYEVAVSRIPALDAEEGAPTLFRLEEVAVEGCDGPVLAYLYQRSVYGRPLCAGDRWVHKDDR
jgi:gamma-glutamylaminecyclotransferase